jgi:hypothetical protein
VKSWIVSILCGAAFAGCVQPADTNVATQSLSGTCPGPNNYPYAKLPPIQYWNGWVKTPGPGQLLLSFPDPNSTGESLVFLVDPPKATIPWAARFKTSSLAQVRSSAGGTGWIDVGRPPPPPPPIGDGWMASYVLELGNDIAGAPDRAAANVQHAVWP